MYYNTCTIIMYVHTYCPILLIFNVTITLTVNICKQTSKMPLSCVLFLPLGVAVGPLYLPSLFW